MTGRGSLQQELGYIAVSGRRGGERYGVEMVFLTTITAFDTTLLLHSTVDLKNVDKREQEKKSLVTFQFC